MPPNNARGLPLRLVLRRYVWERIAEHSFKKAKGREILERGTGRESVIGVRLDTFWRGRVDAGTPQGMVGLGF